MAWAMCVTNLVFSLYEFARANPDPQKWLEQLGNNIFDSFNC